MNKSEQLIACLEGEIAKRDEELAACRVAVENCEVFRARIAELTAELAESRKCAEIMQQGAFASRAITHYEAALLAAFPSGSSGEVFNQWNEARRVLAAAPAAPAADAGASLIEWTKDAVEWGGALNYAAWEFVNECPEKSALLFNNTKGPLRAAIIKYAEIVAANAKDSAP